MSISIVGAEERALHRHLAAALELAIQLQAAVDDAALLRTSRAIFAARQTARLLDKRLAAAIRVEARVAGIKARKGEPTE